jgi:hypothetical protein
MRRLTIIALSGLLVGCGPTPAEQQSLQNASFNVTLGCIKDGISLDDCYCAFQRIKGQMDPRLLELESEDYKAGRWRPDGFTAALKECRK